MSSAFEKLKKARAKKSSAVIQKITKESKSGGAKYQDDRLYYPQRDNSGNGFAVIRFLHPQEGKPAFVKLFNHGWKDAGGWLIENCPTTIDRPCPICEENSKEWQKGTNQSKDLARKRKRKKNYYANIVVVSDPKNPENEGKNFIFRFGQKIFDKIVSASDPEFEDEKAIDPFDLWEGANFKLKIRKVDGNTNYDKSEFDSPSPLFDDDSEIERVWANQYDLEEFISPDQFKSYDDLLKRFARVTGKNVSAESAENETIKESEPEKDQSAEPEDDHLEDQESDLETDGDDDIPLPEDGDEEDEHINYFRNLSKNSE